MNHAFDKIQVVPKYSGMETVPSQSPPPPEPSNSPSSLNAMRPNPVMFFAIFALVINWIVFFGIDMYLGGDAISILPSQDGFVLTSHGRHTAVSENVWVFSLFYSGATLLISPAVVISYAAVTAWKKRKRTGKVMPLIVGAFILFWAYGWFGSIGSSMLRSINDWQSYRQSQTSHPQSH